MIVEISGTAGEVTQSFPIAAQGLGVNNTVRLKYFHLPALPLLDEFKDAVTVNSQLYTIPASSSIEDIVNVLDNFVQGTSRVAYCWYSGSEFEICAGTQNITLSAAFATVLKLPTTLVANSCYSSSLFESSLSIYSHFTVQIEGARGYWYNNAYDSVIAKIRRGAQGDLDVSASHSHYFRAPIGALKLSVQAVTRAGVSVAYVSPEVWSLGLEVV